MIYFSGFCIFFRKVCYGKEDSVRKKIVEFIKLPELLDDSNICFENIFSMPFAFSWSHFLFCSGGDNYLCGFLNGKSGQVIKLKTPNASKIVQVCCTKNHCHLLTESGDYWLYVIDTCEWRNINHLFGAEQQIKDSNHKLLPVAKPFVQKISCGDHVTIAVTNVGLYSVPLLLSFPQIKVSDVCCGKEHTVLLTEHGSVFTWGNGSRGQLGHGELETEEQPRELRALSGFKVIAVAAGGWHSCCITEQGDLYSWGWNCCGQLGFPGEDQFNVENKIKENFVSVLAEPRPVDWPDEEFVVKLIACGSQHTVAVLDDNSMWGCGWNKYGQLMSKILPEKVFCMTKLCVPCDLLKNITHIICGHWNSAFIS